MINEIWKDIKGYEGIYKISNLGNVKSLNYNRKGKPKSLKPGVDTHGYFYVNLTKNGKTKTTKIHRLVAETFVDNSFKKPCVNHIDGNKKNNHHSNLEYCTYQENTIHAFKTGLQKPSMLGKFGKEHHGSVKINQYSLTGEFIRTWEGMNEAKRNLKISQGNISECCNKKRNSAGGYKWEYA